MPSSNRHFTQKCTFIANIIRATLCTSMLYYYFFVRLILSTSHLASLAIAIRSALDKTSRSTQYCGVYAVCV